MNRRNFRYEEAVKKSKEVTEKAQKKFLAKRKKKRGRISKKKGKKKPSYKSDILPLTLDVKLIKQIQQQADLYLDEEDNNQLRGIRPVVSYIEFSALLVHAASHKGVYHTMSWPYGFEWPGLSHVLACRTLSEQSLGSHKLRMALYPAMQSSYGRYSRVRVPMQNFLNEARTAANLDHENLKKRHLAYFHLNQLENDTDNRKHPAVGNTISLFEWNEVDGEWNFHGKGYFSDVRVALHHHDGKTRAHKDQITEYAEIVSDYKQANESVLRFKRSMNPGSVKKLILEYREYLDVIVIDARLTVLKGVASWRNGLQKLIEKVAGDEQAPSIVLLTDDPYLFQSFRFMLLSIKKGRKKKEYCKPFHQYFWLRSEDCLWDKELIPISMTFAEKELMANVTDASILHDLIKINGTAAKANQEYPELARELRRAGGFLRRVANMPVGQNAINHYLEHITRKWSESDILRFAGNYSWRHYKFDLESRLEQLGVLNTAAYERFKKLATRITERIVEVSAVEHYLCEVVCDLAGNGKKILVVVDDYHYIELAKAALCSAIDESVLNWVDVRTEITENDYDVLLIAGTNDRRLKQVLFGQNLPDKIVLLMDAYSAYRIYQNLCVLHEIKEFEQAHKSIEKLLTLIEPKIKSFLQLDSFELPTDAPLGKRKGCHESDLTDPYAILYLSGYGALPIGEKTTLIKRVEDSQSPYRLVTFENLSEGDRIAVFNEEQRDEMEVILNLEESQLSRSAESVLRVYFDMAKRMIKESFNVSYRVSRVDKIMERMKMIDVDVADEITESMVNRWVKNIENFSNDSQHEEEIKSNSPRKKEHFILFVKAIGIVETAAVLYWEQGIARLRTGRILEGRNRSNLIKSALAGADYLRLRSDSKNIRRLFEIANASIYQIDLILSKEDIGEELHA